MKTMHTNSTKMQLVQYLKNYLSQKRMKIKELSIQEVNKNNKQFKIIKIRAGINEINRGT